MGLWCRHQWICGSVNVDPKIEIRKEPRQRSWALWPGGQSGRGVGRFGASTPYPLLGCQMSKYHTGYNYSCSLVDKIVLFPKWPVTKRPVDKMTQGQFGIMTSWKNNLWKKS
jgi:hypothetical protein